MIRSVRAEAARRGRPLPPPVAVPEDIQAKLERGLPLTAAEVARARAAVRREGPPGHHQMAATATPPGPSADELLDNAEACPHRVPMPEGERTGCGCQYKCLKGMGPRHRKGGVLLRDCWACPLAPRLRTIRNSDDRGKPDDHKGDDPGLDADAGPPPGHGHDHGR